MTLDAIHRLDESGMFEALRGFPVQWQTGRARALEADLGGLDGAVPDAVLVAGMGGSAIGGDLLRALARAAAPVPVVVQRSYRLPAWVGAETAVVVSSYSGNTEETLSVMEAAEARGARLVVLTAGGVLRARAEALGLPHVVLPGGMMPRAALGYSLTALLTVAERMGVLRLPDAAWHETQAMLDALAAELADVGGNEALRLADALAGLLPFVYTPEGLLEPVGHRWRTQINENAKTLAAGNVFPELTHNEIMGWQHPGLLTERVGVVVLRDTDEGARVARRIDVTRGLVARPSASFPS